MVSTSKVSKERRIGCMVFTRFNIARRRDTFGHLQCELFRSITCDYRPYSSVKVSAGIRARNNG